MRMVRGLPIVLAALLFTGCAHTANRSPQVSQTGKVVPVCQTSSTPTLYFGHPMGSYNSQTEKELLVKIRAAFPGWRIENPNQLRHQEGARSWQKTTGNGMDYFFKVVLPGMQGGIFLPYRDGKWGAGVYGEALHVFEQGCPVWQINHEGVIIRTTPEKMRLEGGVLSIEDTRARNKLPY